VEIVRGIHRPEHVVRGHLRLRMRHMPFAIDEAARNRWLTLMDRAVQEAELPDEAAAILREFFHGTATFMINRS
jgi:hemoglobin